MSAPARVVNIVSVGQFRKPEYITRFIDNIKVLRSRGFVGKVVFVTWVGELNNLLYLRDAILKNNILLIEIEEQKNSYSPWNTYQQVTQLFYGYEEFEDCEHILKTRHDMAFNAVSQFCEYLEYLSTIDLSISVNDLTSERSLNEKIWMSKIGGWVPFWLGDRVFFGQKSDLKKMLNFSIEYEFILNPKMAVNEVRWFSYPFIEDFPIVRDMLRFNWMMLFQRSLSRGDNFVKIINRMRKFRYFWLCMASYYIICEKYFLVGVPGPELDQFANIIPPSRGPEEYPMPAGKIFDMEFFRDLKQCCEFSAALADLVAPEASSKGYTKTNKYKADRRLFIDEMKIFSEDDFPRIFRSDSGEEAENKILPGDRVDKICECSSESPGDWLFCTDIDDTLSCDSVVKLHTIIDRIPASSVLLGENFMFGAIIWRWEKEGQIVFCGPDRYELPNEMPPVNRAILEIRAPNLPGDYDFIVEIQSVDRTAKYMSRTHRISVQV